MRILLMAKYAVPDPDLGVMGGGGGGGLQKTFSALQGLSLV